MRKLTFIAAALLAAGVSAHAQSTPSSGETLPGGANAPKGELSTPQQDKGSRPPKGSTESRSEVKAEAKDARRSGQLPAGEQSTPRQGKAPMKASGSMESRTEVRQEAKDANRSGQVPKGQESVKDQSKGGKPTP